MHWTKQKLWMRSISLHQLLLLEHLPSTRELV
uniref:Uncharacterized protein n=1 Tax=Setaria viridis TaxID=4556 RepID=A0A4U6TKU7_SETVI|nr:hypothetical protein SEVIR_8G205250v2 [Setaria viridis]